MNQKFLWASSALLLACTGTAKAADWSDTAISVRYGTAFAEPYNNNADGSRKDIKKAIVALTHVSGYKYGTNFLNVDLLMSNAKDPSYAAFCRRGLARLVYLCLCFLELLIVCLSSRGRPHRSRAAGLDPSQPVCSPEHDEQHQRQTDAPGQPSDHTITFALVANQEKE